MPPMDLHEETTTIQRAEETSPTRSHIDVEIARAGVDVAAWPTELAALGRNAKQLSERDATRGALLFGAVSVLAATLERVRRRRRRRCGGGAAVARALDRHHPPPARVAGA